MARAFSHREENVWVNLYKVYVRPMLEYAVKAWRRPWMIKDMHALEAVQMRAIRMTYGLKGLR